MHLVISNKFLINWGNYNTQTNNSWISISFSCSYTTSTYFGICTQRDNANSTNYPAVLTTGIKDRTTSGMKIGSRYVSTNEKAYLTWLSAGY